MQKNKYRVRNSSSDDQTTERSRKASVLVTTVSHVKRSLHQPNAGTRFREKQDQRETFQSRDTSVKRTAKDVLKSTVKIEIR